MLWPHRGSFSTQSQFSASSRHWNCLRLSWDSKLQQLRMLARSKCGEKAREDYSPQDPCCLDGGAWSPTPTGVPLVMERNISIQEVTSRYVSIRSMTEIWTSYTASIMYYTCISDHIANNVISTLEISGIILYNNLHNMLIFKRSKSWEKCMQFWYISKD